MWWLESQHHARKHNRPRGRGEENGKQYAESEKFSGRVSPQQQNQPAVISEKTETRDALYLFACHAEWCTKQSLVEYRELLAAIDDHDCYIRTLAEELLTRSSSRPATDTDIETW